MLSGFLKKLLFARQFAMTDGIIEVLGKKQVMFPSDILISLCSDEKKTYPLVKASVKKNMEYYAKKIGVNSAGMLRSLEDIFETFGLGKVQVINLDNTKKTAILRIIGMPFVDECKNCNGHCVLHTATLAGMFSFLMGKDVDCETKECFLKNKKYCEFVVK